MLSRTYALKIVQHMARSQKNRFSARELGQKLHIPVCYAAKVCQLLANCGILKGYRGPGGGYQIANLKLPLLTFIGYLKCPLGIDVCLKECPFRDECDSIKDKAKGISLMEMPDVRKVKPVKKKEELRRLASTLLWS